MIDLITWVYFHGKMKNSFRSGRSNLPVKGRKGAHSKDRAAG